MKTETQRSIRLTLLFKLLVVFVFFFPFRSVQIPIAVFGFEINPARIVSVLMIIVLGMSACIDVHFLRSMIRSGRYRNPYAVGLFYYFIFSIAYYYMLVASGETLLFGAGEASFLRNWRGRPFAQLMSFITYGLVPFLLVQRYARWERMRAILERSFSTAIVVLAYYALAQVVLYALYGFYISGRNIFERGLDLGSVNIGGLLLYRVNSLAGEPRDFGTFLLGAIPLYMSVRYGKMRWYDFVTLGILGTSFILTTSNSAYLALALFFVFVVADLIYRRRVRIRMKYIVAVMVLLLFIIAAFRAKIIDTVGKRTITMVTAIVDQIHTGKVQPFVREQTSNIVVLYYSMHFFEQSPLYILFGSGYSNFITPVADLYQRYFNRTVEETGILTTDVAAARLFVEGGLVGVALYLLLFIQTLWLNTKLMHLMQSRGDRRGYTKALLLRFSFMAFFIGGSVQNAYYYFIPMGLMIGWLNDETRNESNEKQ